MRYIHYLSIILLLCFSSVITFANDLEEKAYGAMREQKWVEAKQLAKQSNNVVLQNLIQTNHYLDCNNIDKTFEDIAEFILRTPNGAQSNNLQIAAENILQSNSSPSIAVKLFSIYSPLTPKGWKYYAKSLYKVDARSKNIPFVIKQGWIKGSFSAEDQQEYYKKFTSYLTIDDHIKRVNQLLIEGRMTEAKSMYSYLGPKSKKSFDAQMALKKEPKNSDRILKSLPKDCYSEGVIYQYLENTKKKPTNAGKTFELVSMVKDGSQYGNLIWHVQHYIAREYIDKRQYKAAYKAVETHHATDRGDISNAESFAGWLALEFMNQPKIALKHFKKFDQIVSRPISKSRGLYWLGRVYEKLGDKKTANEYFNSAASKYPYTFYGQIALMEQGGKKLVIEDDFDCVNHKIKSDSKILTDSASLFEATRLVAKYGSDNLARTYISYASSHIKSASEAQDFAYLLYDSNNIHYLNWMARNVLFSGILLKNYSYPAPYRCEHLKVEEALAYSIIKQESAFNKMAKSNRDAKGLMQLLESTACSVAKEIDGSYKSGDLMKNECYNIKLGSNYLGSLMDQYDGSYILAAAGYNAGPHKVDIWLKRFGDVRKLRKHRDVINWIEMIPYTQTREYVQRVLENLEVYRSILNPKNNLQMKTNLIQKRN